MFWIFTVVPHAGTWIEIKSHEDLINFGKVVPHAGTWIEITIILMICLGVLVVPHAVTNILACYSKLC